MGLREQRSSGDSESWGAGEARSHSLLQLQCHQRHMTGSRMSLGINSGSRTGLGLNKLGDLNYHRRLYFEKEWGARPRSDLPEALGVERMP